MYKYLYQCFKNRPDNRFGKEKRSRIKLGTGHGFFKIDQFNRLWGGFLIRYFIRLS